MNLLVSGRYADLEHLTQGVRLRASEIKEGVRDYGRTLVHPPPDAYSRIDAVLTTGTSPPAYSIRFRLFTLEEGLSDLELQATFIGDPNQEAMRVELDNIIVA